MTVRCAELSLELDEPLWGSAPVAERWELVERPKPWGRKHDLVAEGAKVLLVKRVGAEERPGRRYLVCTNGAGLGKPIDFGAVAAAPWIGLPHFQAPVWNTNAIALIVPAKARSCLRPAAYRWRRLRP